MRSFIVLFAMCCFPGCLVAQNQVVQYSNVQVQADTLWAQVKCVENTSASLHVNKDSLGLYFRVEIPGSAYQPYTTTGCIQHLDIVNNGSAYLINIYWSEPPTAGPSHTAATTCYDTVLIKNIPVGSYDLMLNHFGGRVGIITDSMGAPIGYTTDTVLCEWDTLNFQVLSNGYFNLNTSIQLYPNPADEYLSFSGFEEEGILQIIDPSGRIVRQKENLQAGGKVSVKGLPEGVYMVWVRSTESGQTFFLKFIKQ